MSYFELLLYCRLRTLNEFKPAVLNETGEILEPEIPDETWKHASRKVLDFGIADEIVQDYVVLAEIGDRVFASCRVTEDQHARIRSHIDGNPELGFRCWGSYQALWTDEPSRALAESVFKYPDSEGSGLTVKEARDAGVTIDPGQIQIPHMWM